MEMQEHALTLSEIVGTNLSKVFPVDETTPPDMQALLNEMDGPYFCWEIAIELADQRVARLLSNTANAFHT